LVLYSFATAPAADTAAPKIPARIPPAPLELWRAEVTKWESELKRIDAELAAISQRRVSAPSQSQSRLRTSTLQPSSSLSGSRTSVSQSTPPDNQVLLQRRNAVQARIDQARQQLARLEEHPTASVTASAQPESAAGSDVRASDVDSQKVWTAAVKHGSDIGWYRNLVSKNPRLLPLSYFALCLEENKWDIAAKFSSSISPEWKQFAAVEKATKPDAFTRLSAFSFVVAAQAQAKDFKGALKAIGEKRSANVAEVAIGTRIVFGHLIDVDPKWALFLPGFAVPGADADPDQKQTATVQNHLLSLDVASHYARHGKIKEAIWWLNQIDDGLLYGEAWKETIAWAVRHKDASARRYCMS